MIEGPVVSGIWIQSHTDFTPTAGSIVLFLGLSVCDARQVNLSRELRFSHFSGKGAQPCFVGSGPLRA